MQRKGSQNTAVKQTTIPGVVFPKSQDYQLMSGSSIGLMRKLFVEGQIILEYVRLRKLPMEQRYLAVKIHSLELVLSFRKAFRRLEFEKSSEDMNPGIEGLNSKRFSPKFIKSFLEGIILISNQDYLDSVGFDFNLIESPQKLFDLLLSCCQEKQSKLTFKDLTLHKQSLTDIALSIEKAGSLQELVVLMCKACRQQILPKMLHYKGSQKELEEQKIRKKEFILAWKNCSEEGKVKMLQLNKGDSKGMVHWMLDRRALMPSPEDVEKEIIDLLKADKNQLFNRVFKSRIKKSHVLLQDYHEMVYEAWRSQVQRKKKIKVKQRSKKRRHARGHRNKSLSVQSNQTNETENRQQVSLDMQELVRMKINQDIIEYSDEISEQANSFFERRVQAFNRLQYILHTYFNTEIHLFGSCACGLAVKNSDIDVAVDQGYLDNFEYVLQNKRVKVALEHLAQILQSRPWIIRLKLINTAAIPIINLTIDTSIQMCQSFMTEVDFYRLNSVEDKGQIDVDLTIQTNKDTFGPRHLGIPSTLQLREWLQNIQKLHEVTIILKHYLSAKSLNNTYSGGLKTYSLVVMIIAYIKDRKLEGTAAVETVLRGLTRFYGYEFEEEKYGIDIMGHNEVFYQKEGSVGDNCAALEVKDPINGKSMTRNCYSFGQIKKLMRDVYQQCFENTEFQIESFCSSLNPKTRKLATHEILKEFNEAFPESNFSKVIGT